MNASNRALGWNTWLTFAISPTAPYWRNANQASGDEVGLVQTGTDTGRLLFTHLRPGRAISKSGHVRHAPKAEVISEH